MKTADQARWAIVGLGLLLGGVLVGEVVVIALTGRVYTLEYLIGAVTAVPPIVALVAGGGYLRRRLPPARHYRVFKWTFTGLGAFALLNVALMVAMPLDD